MGWQDKPPLLTKREIPLDYVPDPEDAPESLRGRGAYVNLSQAILAYLHRVAGNGQWVWREDMATDLRITHEKHFGDSLALLVARSQLERHQGRGSRTCFRLLKGPTPARETNLLKARVLRTLGNEWVSCGGLAERLGVHSSRIAENANELVREGLAEVKKESSYSEKKQGNGNEYRIAQVPLSSVVMDALTETWQAPAELHAAIPKSPRVRAVEAAVAKLAKEGYAEVEGVGESRRVRASSALLLRRIKDRR